MNTNVKTQQKNRVYTIMDLVVRVVRYWREHNISAWLLFFFLIYVVAIIKIGAFAEIYQGNILFVGYSILVSVYIISRFALAYFYTPIPKQLESDYGVFEPTVSFA